MTRDQRILLKLKKYFSDQENVEHFDLWDFIWAFVPQLHAMAITSIFWPNYCLIEGLVFVEANLDLTDKRRIKEMLSEALSSPIEIQQSFNLFEVPSAFFSNDSDTESDDDIELANIICEMWRCKLSRDFPDLHLVVEIVPANVVGGGEPAITIYQIDSTSTG